MNTLFTPPLLRRRMMMMSGKYLRFVDPAVGRICIAEFSSDGIGVTKEDAAAVTIIAGTSSVSPFKNNTDIVSFDELKYFAALSFNPQYGDIFSGCTALKSVTLPDNLKIIPLGTFYGCSSLEQVVFGSISPDFLNSGLGYGNQVYTNCLNLHKVYVDSIDDWYRLCQGAETHSYTSPFAVSGSGTLYVNKQAVASALFPAGVATIWERTYAYITSIVGIVVIPQTVTTIKDEAFRGCSGIQSVEIPAGTSFAGYATFYGCIALTNVVFNGGVNIVNNMFYGCSELATIRISGSGSFSKSGSNQFSGCLKLSNIYGQSLEQLMSFLGSTVWNFATNPFYYRVNSGGEGGHIFINDVEVTSVVIPNTVTRVEYFTFAFLASVMSIDFPSSITSIGDAACLKSEALTTIIMRATTPPTLDGGQTFAQNAHNRKIYVPAGTLSAYQSASFWSAYANDILELDENGNIPT